jgi:hypothetical protein
MSHVFVVRALSIVFAVPPELAISYLLNEPPVFAASPIFAVSPVLAMSPVLYFLR